MKHFKTYNQFRLNEAFSQKIIDILIDKYKIETPDLTDNQLMYYINKFDELKNSPKITEKDILKYSFKDLEKLIDSFPKKVNKLEIGLSNIDNNDILYNENNLLILKGDTKDKCIKYGKGYGWCISRNDSSNMFNSYRYRYNEVIFYFIFDNEKTDDNKAIVLSVDKNNKYYMANASNKGDFAGTKEFTFSEICGFQPKISELIKLFKSLPLTDKEKDIYNKINKKIYEDNLFDFFGSYELIEAYISYGHSLSDNQYINIGYELKNKYINLGHHLTSRQKENTSGDSKLTERYDYLHSFGYWLDNNYSSDEQLEITSVSCSEENNYITNLKGVENLVNLKELYCFNNEIVSLEGIGNLNNLKILICSGNKLTNLKGIENLYKLEELDIVGNNIKSLKSIANLNNLKILKCSTNNLDSLEGIENLYKLEELDCSHNQLTSLKGIENLYKLGDFNCSHNDLKTLKGIENLTNIYELCVNRCGLTNLNDIHKLINLLQIGCDHNNLENLKGIENLKKIKSLYCAGNTNLRSLKSIQNLTNLDLLFIGNNNNLKTDNTKIIIQMIKNGDDLTDIEK